MVVWVFSGGGQSEVKGLIPFLENNFPCFKFTRMMPVRPKPGPKVGRKIQALGKTGTSLRKQIRYRIEKTPSFSKCDIILVLDDLDCRDPGNEKESFQDIFSKNPKTKSKKVFIAFAAPELEAWFIADWDKTFAQSADFRGFHNAIRHALSTKHKVSFSDPESFSQYDSAKKACQEKLSDQIIDAVAESARNRQITYSKAIHTPRLLKIAVASNIANKCPLFCEMYNYLNAFCK